MEFLKEYVSTLKCLLFDSTLHLNGTMTFGVSVTVSPYSSGQPQTHDLPTSV